MFLAAVETLSNRQFFSLPNRAGIFFSTSAWTSANLEVARSEHVYFLRFNIFRVTPNRFKILRRNNCVWYLRCRTNLDNTVMWEGVGVWKNRASESRDDFTRDVVVHLLLNMSWKVHGRASRIYVSQCRYTDATRMNKLESKVDKWQSHIAAGRVSGSKSRGGHGHRKNGGCPFTRQCL